MPEYLFIKFMWPNMKCTGIFCSVAEVEKKTRSLIKHVFEADILDRKSLSPEAKIQYDTIVLVCSKSSVTIP